MKVISAKIEGKVGDEVGVSRAEQTGRMGQRLVIVRDNSATFSVTHRVG